MLIKITLKIEIAIWSNALIQFSATGPNAKHSCCIIILIFTIIIFSIIIIIGSISIIVKK